MKKGKPQDTLQSNIAPEDWIAEALRLARKAADLDEVPVGAVIVHEGKIIGTGHNLRERDQDPLAHAEIRAIEDAAKTLNSWRLIDCTLVVTLEPCPMCLAACQQARVKHVIYGAQDPKGGALSLGYRLNEDMRMNHRFTVDYQPKEECSQVLTEFFARKRQKLTPSE